MEALETMPPVRIEFVPFDNIDSPTVEDAIDAICDFFESRVAELIGPTHANDRLYERIEDVVQFVDGFLVDPPVLEIEFPLEQAEMDPAAASIAYRLYGRVLEDNRIELARLVEKFGLALAI